MSDDPRAMIEVCVEIREDRPLSLGVVATDDAFRPIGNAARLIWLPKTEVRLIHRFSGTAAIIEIPRWLAENEHLTGAIEPPDPNQGVLL